MKELSYSERISLMRDAFRGIYPYRPEAQPAEPPPSWWVDEVFEDHVIVTSDGVAYRVAVAVDDDGVVTFAPADEWVKVEREWVEAQMGELVSLADFAEVGDVIPVQIARTGTFTEKHGREVEITEADLDTYVANFEAGTAEQELPIFQGHPSPTVRPESPATAWYKRLYTKVVDGVKTLWADIELSDLGRDLIAKKLYKYFSPSIDLENLVIKGGGFVNLPAIKGMAAMELSQYLREAEKTGFVEQVRQALRELFRREPGLLADFAVQVRGGHEYPARCFLYVPDADKPSTWKLLVCEWQGGKAVATVAQCGRAAAALGKGFRGKKVSLSAKARTAAKRKLAAAYKRLGVAKEDIPEHLFSEGVKGMTDEERRALEAEIRASIEAEFAQQAQTVADLTESITVEVRAQVEAEFVEKAKREADLSEFVQELSEGGLSTPPDEVTATLVLLSEDQLAAIKPILTAKMVDFSERGHGGGGAQVKQLPDAMKIALSQFVAGKAEVKAAVESFFAANDLDVAEFDLGEFLPKG